MLMLADAEVLGFAGQRPNRFLEALSNLKLKQQKDDTIFGFPKIRGPFLVVRVRSALLFWGPYWGP